MAPRLPLQERPLREEGQQVDAVPSLPRLPSRRRTSLLQILPLDFLGGATGWRRIRSGRRAGRAEQRDCRKPSIAWLAPVALLLTTVPIAPLAFYQEDLLKLYGLNASVLLSGATASRGLLSVLVGPFLGGVSDRWGRKPVLALKAVLIALYQAALACMPESKSRLNVSLILLVAQGLSGSMFGPLFSYCADLVASGSWRSMNGAVALLLAVSFTPGCILGGPACIVCHAHFGSAVMWWLLFALSILNVLYTVFVLPESVSFSPPSEPSSPTSAVSPTSSSRSDSQGMSLNPFIYFKLLSQRGPAGKVVSSILRRIVLILFLLYFAKWSLLSIVTLYAEERVGWPAEKAALLISAWGISQFSSFHVLAIFTRCVARGDGHGAGYERGISWIGLISGLAGMTLLTVSVSGWALYPAMFVGAVSMVTYTSMTAYAGKLVDPSMTGETQCLIATTLDLSELLGPPLFGWLLRWGMLHINDSPWLPNISFAIGALSVLLSMSITLTLPNIELAKSHVTEEMLRA